LKEKKGVTEEVIIDETNKSTPKESNIVHKCKTCDYKTSVPKLLKSHTEVDHSGHFSCSRLKTKKSVSTTEMETV